MKVPAVFVTLACSAVIALEAWNLSAVVDLKTEVAALKATVSALIHNSNYAQTTNEH